MTRSRQCRGIVPVLALAALVGFSATYAQKPEDKIEVTQVEVAAGEAEMPEIIHFKERYAYPLFVAAERVFLPSGQVDPEFFQAPIADGIVDLINLPAKGGCVRVDYTSSLDSAPIDRPDLAAAVRNSDNVILALVTGRRYGFWAERPGALLRIATEKVLKGAPLRDVNYIFFPGGNFRVGKVILCTTNSEYGPLPRVNDRVLVLFDDNWFNDGSELLGARATGIVTLKHGQPAGIPQHYLNTDLTLKNKSADAFLNYIHDLVSEEG